MKSKLLLSVLIMISIRAFSQEKKWSVEVNYPLVLTDDYPDGYDGFGDLGLKYRFISFGVFDIGAGLSGGLLGRKSGPSNNRIKGRLFYVQPTVFAEMRLQKFRPSVGLGYSFWSENVSGPIDGQTSINVNDNIGGLNANFGLSYDVAKSVFLKVQYDYTRLRSNKNVTIEGQNANINRKENVGLLKFGVGIRF